MAFKMNGFSGFKNVADTGYAGSSAFQNHKKGHAKTKEDYMREGFDQAEADQMSGDGATTGKQQSSMPKAKKSTTAVDGQLNDAQNEYEQDKKLIAQMKRKQAALKPEGDQGDFTPAYEGADIEEKEYKRQLAKKAVEKGIKPSPKPSYKPEKVKNESLRGKMQSLLPKEQKIIEPIMTDPVRKESSLKKHVKGHGIKPTPRPRPTPPVPPTPRPPRRKPPRAIDYGPRPPRVGK